VESLNSVTFAAVASLKQETAAVVLWAMELAVVASLKQETASWSLGQHGFPLWWRL
jgi:hypothetical protein